MSTERAGVSVLVRWETALADAAHGLDMAGLGGNTIQRVTKHVRKFASESGCPDPWKVTPLDVSDWLSGVSTVYGSSLRTFYRWAHKVGRVERDPAAGTSGQLTKREPPADWREPIAAYRCALMSGGATWQSLETRTYYVTRLALEVPNDGPWRVTEEDLVWWLARHRWSPETTRSARNTVRSFFQWAAQTGRVAESPAEHLRPVRLAEPSRRPAAEEVYAGALSKAEPRESLMLRLAAELGLRRNEIATVASRNLTSEPDGYWLAVKGKGGKLRHLPVPDSLAAAMLDQWQGRRGYLFPGAAEDGHLSARYLGKCCSDLLPAGTTLHALRHRFATVAYGASHDLFATQTLLGHSNPSTTQRYVHTSSADLRAAVDAART